MDLIKGTIIKEIEERIADGETFIKQKTAEYDKATDYYKKVSTDPDRMNNVNAEIEVLKKYRDKLKADGKETWENVDNAINDILASVSLIKNAMQGLDEAMKAYSDSFTFEHPDSFEMTDRPLGGSEADINAHLDRLADILSKFKSIVTVKNQAIKDSNDKVKSNLLSVHEKANQQLDLAGGVGTLADDHVRTLYDAEVEAYQEFLNSKSEYDKIVPALEKYLAGIAEDENLIEFKKEEQARKDVINKAKVEVDKKGLKVMLNRTNDDHSNYNEKIVIAKNLLNEEINNTFGTISEEENNIINISKERAVEEKLGMLTAVSALKLTRAHLWSLAEVEKEIREACSRGITSIEVHRSLRLPTLKMLVDLGYNISQSDDKNKFRIIIDWSHAGSAE
jgi:hypothetical protein